jgi:putative iron-only hydrogenase system regulator
MAQARRAWHAGRAAEAAFPVFSFHAWKDADMEQRVGFVGIIVEDRHAAAPRVNEILTECGRIIVARTGLPYARRGCSVITLIVDATTDEIGELTGRLGQLPGVSVKSALSRSAPPAHADPGGLR